MKNFERILIVTQNELDPAQLTVHGSAKDQKSALEVVKTLPQMPYDLVGIQLHDVEVRLSEKVKLSKGRPAITRVRKPRAPKAPKAPKAMKNSKSSTLEQ